MGDPSITLINLHYKKGNSYNVKRFSLRTQKLLRIFQKSLLQILPLNISSDLYSNPNKPYIFWNWTLPTFQKNITLRPFAPQRRRNYVIAKIRNVIRK